MNKIYIKFLKRFFDIIFCLLLFLPMLAFFLVIIPIIYFTDKGDIFYLSDRVGINGNLFQMYKFRSMKMDSEDIRNSDGSTFNAEDDERVTRIGKIMRKTSLDELPQLINVLKGDMSIIGPRPDLPDALKIYNSFERKKLEVRPGITGYNQAYFRNSINQAERFKNDVYYSQNISFLLDIKILINTFYTVLTQKNINHGDKED